MTHANIMIVAIKTDAMSSKIGYYIIKPKSNFYLKDQKTLIFQHKKELLFLNLNAQICDVIRYDGTYVRTFPSRRKGSASSYQCYPALGLAGPFEDQENGLSPYFSYRKIQEQNDYHFISDHGFYKGENKWVRNKFKSSRSHTA